MNKKPKKDSFDFLPSIKQGLKKAHEVSLAIQEQVFSGAEKFDSNTLLNAIHRYIAALEERVANNLSKHSIYYWFYCWRRARIDDVRRRFAHVNWEERSMEYYDHESGVQVRFESRVTLAIVKYGKWDLLDDMQYEMSEDFKRTGNFFTNGISWDDSYTLFVAVYLLREISEARYHLKKAGKGGQFFWSDKTQGEFDVRVVSDEVNKLIAIYDFRDNQCMNLLSFFGSWSQVNIVSELFPLPQKSNNCDDYVLIKRHPNQIRQFKTQLAPRSFTVLNLDANFCQQHSPEALENPITRDSIDVPPWLFTWHGLYNLLPRFEMYNGLLKEDLGLDGVVSFDPEDIVFALSAITTWQRQSCEENPDKWFTIIQCGYSIWVYPEQIVVNGLLNEFSDLRERFVKSYDPKQNLPRLKAALKQLIWSETNRGDINILASSPVRPILPLDSQVWLIDWTMMLLTLIDWQEPISKGISDHFGEDRGRDVERQIGKYIIDNLYKSDIKIWRIGLDQGKLWFTDGKSRDADLALVVNDTLIIVEITSLRAERALKTIGDPNKLQEHWGKLHDKITQVETLAKKLIANRDGENFKVPKNVKQMVALVCVPQVEWIPFKEKRYWLFDNIPIVCTPDELLDVIKRIQTGDFPENNTYFF